MPAIEVCLIREVEPIPETSHFLCNFSSNDLYLSTMLDLSPSISVPFLLSLHLLLHLLRSSPVIAVL